MLWLRQLSVYEILFSVSASVFSVFLFSVSMGLVSDSNEWMNDLYTQCCFVCRWLWHCWTWMTMCLYSRSPSMFRQFQIRSSPTAASWLSQLEMRTLESTLRLSTKSSTKPDLVRTWQYNHENEDDRHDGNSNTHTHVVLPVGTREAINKEWVDFLSDLGRLITQSTDDHRESAFLFQRLTVLIQRYNTVTVLGTFTYTTSEEEM